MIDCPFTPSWVSGLRQYTIMFTAVQLHTERFQAYQSVKAWYRPHTGVLNDVGFMALLVSTTVSGLHVVYIRHSVALNSPALSLDQ